MNYSYPFSSDWSTDEVVDVVRFYEAVEKAYEKGIDTDTLNARYKRYKEIVPSKSEEKQYDKAFQAESGYSTYRVIEKMKKEPNKQIVRM